jgi:glycosyltransferase involved in cell wall biosynthesis
VGAIPELIDDQRSGMLVEPRNADALARALDAVLADGEFRDRLAHEAYRTALREFEIEAAVDRLVREIEGTIAAGRESRLSGQAL